MNKSSIPQQDLLFTNANLRDLIIPLVLEQLLAITVGMADTMMVSSVGEAAISGVALVDIINVMITGILTALATGGAVVISQFIGAKKAEQARRAAKQLMGVAVIAGLIIMALVLILRGPLLSLFYHSIDQDVRRNALKYLAITACAYPFIASYHAGAAIFRSMRCSHITFRISAFMNLLNVAGNAVCILVLHMGVEGVAIPSLLSYITACIVMRKLLSDTGREVWLGSERFFPEKDIIRKILYIGVPNGIENGLFQLGRVLVVSIVSVFGTTEIAANGIANNLDQLGILLGLAVNFAATTVIGQCVGARSEEQVRLYTGKLFKIIYVSEGLFNIVLLLLLPKILLIYRVSPDTRELASKLIWIHNGGTILLWPTAFLFPAVLRACNDVRFTMVTGITAMFVFRIGLGYILGVVLEYGSVGVWIAMILDWIFRTACYILRYRSGKWRITAGLA